MLDPRFRRRHDSGRMLVHNPSPPRRAFGGPCRKAQDIVDTAVAAGQFKTLAAAAGGWRTGRNAQGQGTLHGVRTHRRCLKKLPAGTVENLLKPENKAQLVESSTYHVVPGQSLGR